MKPAFEKLAFEKRVRIIQCSIKEFGSAGYDHCSLDRIVQNAAISKGGLYEYISSKEDLFLFLADYSIDCLYNYIENIIATHGMALPEDILDRFKMVSSIAIDFYIGHSEIIAFIVKCDYLFDQNLCQKVNEIFMNRFLRIFGSAHGNERSFDYKSVLDMLQWLLVKTRKDFLSQVTSGKIASKIKSSYLKEWKFYFSVLRNGIYKTKTTTHLEDS